MQKNFAVYKSSAGSGKTYTLVKEYLKLALGDAQRVNRDYRQVLAITFTNKASAEMKERILKALAEIAAGEQTYLSADLRAELAISAPQLQARCSELHKHILHQYTDFAVCTIDSFVYRLIKRFSIDLQLPAAFIVETDEDAALNWAIDEMLSNMQQNKLLQEALINYAAENVDEQKSWKIEHEIFQLARTVFSKKDNKEAAVLSQLSLEQLTEVKKDLRSRTSQAENFLRSVSEKAYALIARHNILPEDFRYGKSGFFNYFKKLADKNFDRDELNGARVLDAVKQDKWYSGKEPNAAIDEVKEELRALYYEADHYLEKNGHTYYLNRILLKNMNALSVLNEVNTLVNKYKEEKNIVFISEFNRAVAQFIQDEPVPFIYERLGDRYKHYLLDEFQDTSALQWLNLLPLVHNSLSEGKFCMLVGDGKQSIYRWRGADVEQFTHLPYIKKAAKNKVTEEQEQALTVNYEERQLNTNRRSCAEIISFNNDLFEWLPETYLDEEHAAVYKNAAQQTASRLAGKVTLTFIPQETEEQETEVLLKTEQFIREALEKGYSYNDIAVISRNNRHGSHVAQYLMEHGIPVISSDSLLLRTCAEVNFLVSFLSWLSNPNDAVSACAILTYLQQTFSLAIDHTIIQEVGYSPYKLNNALQDTGFSIPKEYLQTLPLYEICTEIIRHFKIAKHNPLFVNFFLDEVASFNERESASVFLFLEWWSLKSDKLSVKIPQNTNAVKVMTIHSSKGLEFPVVIFPFADWSLQRSEQILIETEDASLPVALVRTGNELKKTAYKEQSTGEEQKQLLDSLNMVYVANTRAVDALHIIAREKKMGGSITNWLKNFITEKYASNFSENFFEKGIYPQRENKIPHELKQLQPVSYRNMHEHISVKLTDYDTDEQNKRLYGISLHEIFSRIRSAHDIDNALQAALAAGNIHKEQVATLKENLTAISDSPLLAPYFAENAEVKNETELFRADGEIIRPDRVVIMPDHLAVIDFKTGEKKSSHIKQLQLYMQTLRAITGKNVKAFLAYLPAEVLEVI